MADLEAIKKEVLSYNAEEIKAAIKDRGRKVRCPECSRIAYSVDTVAIFCPECGAKIELDPYWV